MDLLSKSVYISQNSIYNTNDAIECRQCQLNITLESIITNTITLITFMTKKKWCTLYVLEFLSS